MSKGFENNVIGQEITKMDLAKQDCEPKMDTNSDVRPRVRKYIQSWAENSSCNGIPSIARSHHPFRKILWILIFLAGSGLAVWQVTMSFIKYLNYPVGVGINVTSVTVLQFPAVTFCNVNQVRKSYIVKHLPEFEQLLPLTFGGGGQYSWDTSDRLEIREQFDNQWAQVDTDKRHAAGHQKEDMILDCSFSNQRCSEKDFHLTLNPVLGNCYTFNSGWHGDHLRVSHKAGALYGLTLELLIEEEEYIPELAENAGVKLLVHPSGHMPFPQDMGLFLQPGQMTSMATRLMNITRQAFPYPSNCYQEKGHSTRQRNVYAEKYNVSYTVAACTKSCYQSWVISNCSCGDPTIPLSGEAVMARAKDKSAIIKPCLSEEEEQCEDATKDLYIDGKLQCDCPLECVDLNYLMTPSQSVWPNSLFADTYYKYMAEKHTSVKRLADDFGTVSIRNSLIKIQVFFTELAYESVEEIPAYPTQSLIADLGGTMGFYLGVSVVAFFEFFELLLDLMRICIVRLTTSETAHTTRIQSITND